MVDIAWIGLGTMGLPMAKNLAGVGHRVVGVDVSARARQAATRQGIDVVEDMADAVKTAVAIFTMLPKGEHVRSVFEAEDGIPAHVRQRALVVDTSTVDVATSRWCHERGEERGFDFVDSPARWPSRWTQCWLPPASPADREQ